MINRVKFVSIPFVDQERALSFWRDSMGFKVATDQVFDEKQRWIELKIPGAETQVVLFTADGTKAGGFFNGAFTCDNIQKTYEELKARGVEFVQPPKTESWGTSTIFKDTEGNTFVLSSK
jgi:predicted enzyme related to lactoylglutathione lyase